MKQHSFRPISLLESILLFGLPALLLYGIAYYFMPFLQQAFSIHPGLSWFIGGAVVFIALFILAIVLYKKDFHASSFKTMLSDLRFLKMTKRDWKYSLIGLLCIFLAMGVVFGISQLLHIYVDIPLIQTDPPFLQFDPFVGIERFYLLVWLVMFFFNIVGEEFLWHGYMLQRQEATYGKYAWLVNGLFWGLFHFAFGVHILLLVAPSLFIIPYIIQKTKNTTNGIVVHGLMNGPIFILIALGIIDKTSL